MDKNDCHNEVRAPSVQAANEPAQADTVIESLKAVPSFTSGRHVDERQHNAGDDLKHEHDDGRAAENIKPARGFARNGMLGGLADGRAKLNARVQPITDRFDQAHGRISRTILEAWPGVGISPALINNFPPSIL